MLDFSKLGVPMTDEEREAQRRELEDSLKERIAKRSEKIEALCKVEGLSAWEQKFIGSMQYCATTYDMSGLLGERLLYLTEKQLEALDGLYAKHCKPSVQAAKNAL